MPVVKEVCALSLYAALLGACASESPSSAGVAGTGGYGLISIVGDGSLKTSTTCDEDDASSEDTTTVGAIEAMALDAATCVAQNPNVSFSKDVAPILPSCFGELCHTWNYELLTQNRSAECCDKRKIIEPREPSHSYLFQKVTGQDLCGLSRRMPLGGTLTDTQVQAIFDWICLGAQDN